jgi:uncharacterized protein
VKKSPLFLSVLVKKRGLFFTFLGRKRRLFLTFEVESGIFDGTEEDYTMERTSASFLRTWLHSKRRLPLIIRGARQVGKTWLVREFAESEKRELVEINLEMEPGLEVVFQKNDPASAVQKIDELLNKKVDPSKTILFIDEIQTKPHIIAKLRWFAELMPELPVIAAGSLLEFALGNFQMSMPVGRVEYMYLEPLSFEEFLLAQNKEGLVRFLKRFSWGDEVSDFEHTQLMSLFNEYVIVGGMPAAVIAWTETKSLQEVSRVHRYILSSYRADFSKYGTRISSELIEKTLMAIPPSLGKKFVYSSVDRAVKIANIQKALDALEKARVAHLVRSTSANGIPLGAEVNEKFLKVILLDVGLSSAALGISLSSLETLEDLTLINKGEIAEQVTGQLLRTVFTLDEDPMLYYWVRLDKGSSAEIDYVVAHGALPVPIEVKAGSAGSLKSLHIFMHLKGLSKAVRVYSGLPLIDPVSVKIDQDTAYSYELRSFPFYLLGELHRLLA